MEKVPEKVFKDSPEQQGIYFDPQTGAAITFHYSILDLEGKRVRLDKEALERVITEKGEEARIPNYILSIKRYLEAQRFIVED
jgi:hypothetical protein